MPLTKFQQSKCLELVDKMIEWPICYPFIEMVDPERDGAPDYLETIKTPMALSEVKKRVNDGTYESLDGFKKDVNLIWANAELYNGPDAIYTQMAKEAELWFNKKMDHFPTSAEAEWTEKVQKVTKKLSNVLAHPPPDLDPNGKQNSSEQAQ